MNLFFFPEAPVSTNGYGLAVQSDYLRLNPKKEDIIIWYTNNNNNDYKSANDIIIKREPLLSLKRIISVLQGKVSVEVKPHDLRIPYSNYDSIFCGDIIAYRAIRLLFPNTHISVRFHNCFSRIKNRMQLLNVSSSDWIFKINLASITRLEHEIFRDKNCTKIFITTEDCDYYSMMTGKNSDCMVWPFLIDKSKGLENRNKINPHTRIRKIVWYGGIEAHKSDSVKWFINEIFPDLKKWDRSIEFYLWGKNTEKFNNPKNNIFAYGYYNGPDFPYANEALYINPDIIGGGVKTKLQSYFEKGIPFISTPFGFEGYDKSLIDGEFCIVESPENWVQSIIKKLENNTSI